MLKETNTIRRNDLRDVMHRKNVMNLTKEELADFRKAMISFMAIKKTNDRRGYQYWAEVHGLPAPNWCDADGGHGGVFFPWHRAYLYQMEIELQRHMPGMTQPYWNWNSPNTVQIGIPPAYAEPNDAEGNTNPLHAGEVRFENRMTKRLTGSTQFLQIIADTANYLIENDTIYTLFNSNLGRPHGSIHVWVGGDRREGDMSSTSYAAFDPIFWAHHSNVDRIWAKWQDLNDNAHVPNLGRALSPFSMVIRQTLVRQDLGYDYIAAEIFEHFKDKPYQEGLKQFNRSPTQVNIKGLADPVISAILELHHVHHPLDGSFLVHVFINQLNADEKTPLDGNNHYAGTFSIFSKIGCPGDPGHCDVPREPRQKFDLTPTNPMKPYKLYLDVTKTVLDPQVVNGTVVEVSFVCVDGQGKKVEPGIKLEALSLVLRD